MNAAMLFTWNVEMALLGLVCRTLSSTPRDVFLSTFLLLDAVLALVAHVACLSLALPSGHQAVSVAVLALNLGLGLAAIVDPSQDSSPVRQAVVCAVACVLLLVSLGLAFASSAGGRTFLMFHHSVLSGVLWPIVLVTCAGSWVAFAVLGIAAAVAVLYALRWTRVALWVNTLLAALVVAGGVSLSLAPPLLGVAAGVAACLFVWAGLAVWDRALVVDEAGEDSQTKGDSLAPSAPPQSVLPSAPTIELATDAFQFLDLRPGLRVKPREKFY